MRHRGTLVKVDNAAVLDTQLHRLVPRLDVPIQQQAVGVLAAKQPRHQPAVVQHVGVHQNHWGPAAQHGPPCPERHDAALAEIRVEHHGHAGFFAQHGLQCFGSKTRHDGDLCDRMLAERRQMPGDQAAARELQQRLRLSAMHRGIAESAANAGGQDQRDGGWHALLLPVARTTLLQRSYSPDSGL